MFGKTNYWPHINELINRVRKLETENKVKDKEIEQLRLRVKGLEDESLIARKVLSRLNRIAEATFQAHNENPVK